ncbi:hypothetical protein ON010_g3267 [Phytophthora cinnamomi]|nr:hypothetical protein ON010_g3267 [Phytophthora cinnamomi]
MQSDKPWGAVAIDELIWWTLDSVLSYVDTSTTAEDGRWVVSDSPNDTTVEAFESTFACMLASRRHTRRTPRCARWTSATSSAASRPTSRKDAVLRAGSGGLLQYRYVGLRRVLVAGVNDFGRFN